MIAHTLRAVGEQHARYAEARNSADRERRLARKERNLFIKSHAAHKVACPGIVIDSIGCGNRHYDGCRGNKRGNLFIYVHY